MESGFIAIIITLCIIVSAIKTRRCVECMLLGSLIAAFFTYGKDFLAEWCNVLQKVMAEEVWVFLVCLLFGALIEQLTASRGSLGFSKYLAKLCNSDKKTFLTTYVMGILIFVDDYLNVLSIGACMKKIFDDRKIPREALAYTLNSTGAPVCVLLPLSTWAVFYASLFYGQESVQALGCATPLEAYAKAIPFCFYPIITLFFVFLFAMGWMPRIGPMKKAFLRVQETGKVYSDFSRKYNHKTPYDEDTEGNIWYFLIPMGILIGLAVLTGNILVSVVVALVICFLLYIPRKVMTTDEFMNNTIQGFSDMLPLLTMLLVTFVLKDICGEMGMTEYIVEKTEPFLFPAMYPAMVFILGAVLAFTTGSDWGMSSIITPVVFPLGAIIGANPVLIMAAVISGGTFGNHACFYSDATLLAAQSAGIDSMEHALSQLPYNAISCALSILGFIIMGIIM